MKKLFSIFCCLLLSASMVTQAQLLDALNESPLRDANLVDASLQVVSGEINLSDDNGEYYIIEKNGSRKAPAATVYALMKNSTLQYVNVQKTSTTNCFNVFIKTQNNYSGTTVTGFVIKNVNFGAADYIRGEHSFTSSYSNCTESDNWFVQNFSSASGGLYVDNPYGKIKFTYSSWGGDGYPIYRVQIYSCYGYTYNNRCINWKNSGAVFELDQYLSVHPFASDGSTRIDFTDYYKLTVVSESASKGSVSGDGSASGGQYYAAGSSHSNLTATPSSASYAFSKWQKNGADFSGNTANPLSITLNSNDTYTAIFNAVSKTYTISTAASPVNYGSASGGGTYAENTSATLTATPASLAYGFVKWQKNGADFAGNTVNPITVTVTAAATYTAVFEHLPQGVITVTANPTYGTATGSGSYERGTNVNISAIPNSGYRFAQWDDGDTNNPRTITVTGNKTYTAQFYDLNQPLLASFSWDDDDISVEQYGDGNSLCNSFYAPYGKNFYLLYAKANSRSSKNYLNLSIQSSQSQMWGDLSFFKVGDYPVVGSSLTTNTIQCDGDWYSHAEWFWSLSQTNVCVAYGYDSYSLGLNPLGTYLCDKSGSASDESDQSNYITVDEGITCKIEVGKNGDPYIRLVRNTDQQCLVSVGAPAVKYALSWDANGGELSGTYTAAGSVNEGTSITAPTATRTGYTFTGWSPAFTGTMPSYDVTYTAQWTANTHTLTWTTDGNPLTGTYTSGTVAYGTTIVAPATPTKDAAGGYAYTFNGWDADNNGTADDVLATMPDNDLTYTALWTATPTNFTITYDAGANGSGEIAADTKTPGTPITLSSSTFSRDNYTQTGWSTTDGGEKAYDLGAEYSTDANITLYPYWTLATAEITLRDNESANYYNTFADDYDSVKVETVTYSRTFRANTWSTVCLPFDVNEDNLSGAGWLGSVYEFKHAEGTANVDDGLYLNFYPAREMEAGKGYLVYSQGAALEGGFEFYDVTIKTDADTKPTITDLAGYNDGQGTITLVGTLRQGTLTPNATSQMALKDNMVWYPGSGTTTIRAYRGFFKDSSGSSIPPRVHIVVEGEVVTDLEIMENGELRMDNDNVRKYMDNGVLIIERNGIRYDAQGKRIEN